jgi:cation transporter-like permease
MDQIEYHLLLYLTIILLRPIATKKLREELVLLPQAVMIHLTSAFAVAAAAVCVAVADERFPLCPDRCAPIAEETPSA